MQNKEGIRSKSNFPFSYASIEICLLTLSCSNESEVQFNLLSLF